MVASGIVTLTKQQLTDPQEVGPESRRRGRTGGACPQTRPRAIRYVIITVRGICALRSRKVFSTAARSSAVGCMKPLESVTREVTGSSPRSSVSPPRSRGRTPSAARFAGRLFQPRPWPGPCPSHPASLAGEAELLQRRHRFCRGRPRARHRGVNPGVVHDAVGRLILCAVCDETPGPSARPIETTPATRAGRAVE